MEIEKLDNYSDIIYKLENHFEEFEEFVENQTSSDKVRDFLTQKNLILLEILKKTLKK